MCYAHEGPWIETSSGVSSSTEIVGFADLANLRFTQSREHELS